MARDVLPADAWTFRRSLAHGWRLALGTLTVVPSGPVDPSPAAARVMVALAPAAVLPLAAGAAGFAAAGDALNAPALVIGLVVAAWLAATTRAMHLDAVADVADGFAAGWNPERARAVLRRGDVGPAGVVVLVFVLGLQGASLGALAERPAGWLIIGVAVAVSRWGMAPVCAGPPAMPGSRLGRVYAGALPWWQATAWPVLGGALLTAAVMVAGSPWWWGVIAAGVAASGVLALRAVARRTFEGMNGDVLGASIELGLTAMLVVLACR